jgi:hypothetical protein
MEGLTFHRPVGSRALSLHDRQPHGLVVRIQLPVHQQIERTAA